MKKHFLKRLFGLYDPEEYYREEELREKREEARRRKEEEQELYILPEEPKAEKIVLNKEQAERYVRYKATYSWSEGFYDNFLKRVVAEDLGVKYNIGFFICFFSLLAIGIFCALYWVMPPAVPTAVLLFFAIVFLILANLDSEDTE